MPMNELKHLSLAILINGTFGVLIWLMYVWAKFGLFWSSDTPQVWLLGLFIVGLFISLICYPIFRLYGNTQSVFVLPIVGAGLGIMSVLAFFVVATNYPVNIEYMIIRAWLYYIIFPIIGGAYGFMYFAHAKA
jgi:hypothetical protein